MPDASPTRWHLAHTTWFFETFILAKAAQQQPDQAYAYLFNSYYNAVGDQFPRAERGLLSRPTVAEIADYRRAVDERMIRLAESGAFAEPELAALLEVGLNHEQQHQELMLTDIKHAFSRNPISPVYREAAWERCTPSEIESDSIDGDWIDHDGGIVPIGHDEQSDLFAYDNESPRHRVLLEPYCLANRLVTCGEYLQFMEDGGYRRPELWLSEGWANVLEHGWNAPLYWQQSDAGWQHFTLAGMKAVDPSRPVCHISLFEADAYARWAGARLPTEFEWEHASASKPVNEPLAGNFADKLMDARKPLHPAACHSSSNSLTQLYGDCWEWTTSSYAPYPGYQPAEGAIGEYNGKFMCNQYVLRGGSCATPTGHIRPTYRNFFPAQTRWQFSGIRLAK